MAVAIADLFVTVGADVTGATQGLNQLNQQIQRVGAGGVNLTRIGNSIRTFGSQAKTVGTNLTTDLTAPIVGIAGAVFSAGSDFEHAFTQVKSTVDGLDDTQLQTLRADLLDMAKGPAGGLKTASELAEIASVGGQLGLAGGDIKDFTSLVARLSLATDLPFAQVADDVGRAINVIGLSKSQFEAFGSVITKLGNDFGGTEADILEFSRRIGGTLTSVGVKPQQIEAIGAALSAAGVLPEAGGTAINQFFVDMTNALNDTAGASDEAKQKLQSLKDTIADLSGNLEVASLRQREFGRNTPASVVRANQLAIDKYQRELGTANTKMAEFDRTSAKGTLSLGGMAEVAGVSEEEFRNLVKTDPARAFAAFVSGLQRIKREGGPEAVTKSLADLGITGDRQRETLLNLANSQQDLTTALNIADDAWNKQNALTTEVETRMADLQNQIKLAANTLQVSMIEAFDKTRPAIQKLIDQINTDLIPAFQKMVAEFPVLSPEQLKFIGLLAGIGPAIFVIGAAAGVLGPALAGIGAIATALSLPALVVAGIIIGLAVGAVLIATHLDEIKAALGTLVTFLSQWDAQITDSIRGTVDKASTNLDRFATLNSAHVIDIRNTLFPLTTFLDQWDKSITDAILATITKAGENLVTFAGLMAVHGTEIRTGFTELVTFLSQWDKDITDSIRGTIVKAGEIFGAFGDFLGKFFDQVVGPALDRFTFWIREKILGPAIGLLEFLQKLGISTLPGGADIGTTIADLKAQQAAASTAAGGGNNVNVNINNPQVTSQDLLDKLVAQAQEAMTYGLIIAEQSANPILPPQPLPGQVPGAPF